MLSTVASSHVIAYGFRSLCIIYEKNKQKKAKQYILLYVPVVVCWDWNTVEIQYNKMLQVKSL